MTNKKQTVLITGGTQGIGLELSKLFAQDGYNLVIVARDERELSQTSALLKSHGGTITTISKDLFDPQNAFAVYDEVKQKGITVNVLVNNAAQGHFAEFAEGDLQRDLDIVHLNISSVLVLTKLFLKDMVARNEGKILNTSSVASQVPGPWQSVYHGTKAFIQSWSQAIRSELDETEIIVTTLLPGATDTDFFNKADMLDSKVVQEGELADPAQVAKDGYEALKKGKDMVVSGFKNKLQTGMSNLVPDSKLADTMKKQQEPVSESK